MMGRRGERVGELFDNRAATYSEYTVWADDLRLIQAILEPLATMVPDAACLDIGGGTGTFAAIAHERVGGRWTVCDLSAQMLARVPAPLEPVQADATDLPFEDGEFGFSTIRAVLEYVDVGATLREARRVTHHEGRVVISEKVMGHFAACDADWYRAVQRLRSPLKGPPQSTGSIVRAVSASGMRVLQSLELRRDYQYSLSEWLSRSGTIGEHDRRALRELVVGADDSFRARTGLQVLGDELTMPISWCVCVASPQPGRALELPLVASAGVFCLRDGEPHLLLQRRRRSRHREPEYFDRWELPQGHVERDESLDEAAVRELREETGIELRRWLTPIAGAPLGNPGAWSSASDLTLTISRELQFTAVLLLAESVPNAQPRPWPDDLTPTWCNRATLEHLSSVDAIYPLNTAMVDRILASWDEIAHRLATG